MKIERGLLPSIFGTIGASSLMGLNPNCPDLDIAETCEFDCEGVHLQCLAGCANQDSSCISKCTRDFADCIDVCPCYTNCPNGCPCPTFSDYCPVSVKDLYNFW